MPKRNVAQSPPGGAGSKAKATKTGGKKRKASAKAKIKASGATASTPGGVAAAAAITAATAGQAPPPKKKRRKRGAPKDRIEMCIDDNGDWIRLDRHWVPALEPEKPSTYLFRVEIAPSGRATCKTCGEKVPKGDARLGKPVKWGGGTNGFISGWSHVKCTRWADVIPPHELKQREEAGIEFPDPAENVFGFAALSDANQALLRSELGSKEAPSHIEVIDVNDPGFLSKGTIKPVSRGCVRLRVACAVAGSLISGLELLYCTVQYSTALYSTAQYCRLE